MAWCEHDSPRSECGICSPQMVDAKEQERIRLVERIRRNAPDREARRARETEWVRRGALRRGTRKQGSPNSPFSAEGGKHQGQAMAELAPGTVDDFSLVDPSLENPYCIQPHDPAFFEPSTLGYEGICSFVNFEGAHTDDPECPAEWVCKPLKPHWYAMCDYHMSKWTGWENRVPKRKGL